MTIKSRLIYLVRHGKIQMEDNQRRYIGQIDFPLDNAGIRQAKWLQTRLDQAEIAAVYSSDLLRSQQTAEIIAANKAIQVHQRKDLREIHLGEWEGKTFSDIAQRFPVQFKARGADVAYYRIPGGESFADCSSRVVKAFDEIVRIAPAGDILIVGHAGVNRLILCHILGLPIAKLFRVSQEYGCLNIIQSNSSSYQVKLVNYYPFGAVTNEAL